MDLTPDDSMWPSIPAELKYVELRLPGTFRELVANRSFTNEEIGRIIRCIVLDTDFFINQKIEAEVFYYRKKLIDKNRTRLRVDALRKRRKAGVLSAEMGGMDGTDGSVTVTHMDSEAIGNVADSLSQSVKTPSNIIEKTPPIIPLEKNPSSSLESDKSKGRSKTKHDRIADTLQQDLFALVSDTGSRVVEKESTERRTGCPETRPSGFDESTHVQDIGSAQNGVSGVSDTRTDAAWIPERFAVFWEKYPRRVGRASAVKTFTKLIKQQKDVEKFMKTLLSSIEWWKKQPQWTKENGKFIPYPATFINKGFWEDINENNGGSETNQAEFLNSSSESDEELIRRMQGE